MAVKLYPADEYDEVYCTSIMRKGKRIYPKRAKFFHFWVKKKK